MATLTISKKEKKKENNYIIEGHDDYCIVKRKKGNKNRLKVLLFSSSIINELENIEEKEKEDLKKDYNQFLEEFLKKLRT
jgi:hypothetical protein